MFLFRGFGLLGNLHLTYGSSPLADRAYDVSADNANAACKPSSPVAEQKAGMHARHAAWKSKSKGSGRSCACQAIEFHRRAAAKYCRYLDKQVLAGVQFLTARLGWAPLHTHPCSTGSKQAKEKTSKTAWCTKFLSPYMSDACLPV